MKHYKSFNSAFVDPKFLKEIAIDREEELRSMYDSLVRRYHNIILYGERGVGKTFLIRLLSDSIESSEKSIFTCYLSIANLNPYGPDGISGFPRVVLLQLCADLWTRFENNSYLDLREGIQLDNNSLLGVSNSAKTIQRIYSMLMLTERQQLSKRSNSFGVSAGIKGEFQDEISSSKKIFDVLPFEFAEFIGEIQSKVLSKKGISKIICFCDEGNLMPIFNQESVLENYLEMFSSKGVQFVFVAGHHNWETKPYIPSCFETSINLGGFSKAEYIEKLISNYDFNGHTFSKAAVELVFEKIKGNPRNALNICELAIRNYNTEREISTTVMQKAINDYEFNMIEYKEQVKKEI